MSAQSSLPPKAVLHPQSTALGVVVAFGVALLLGGNAEADEPSWTGTWQSKWRGSGALLHLQQDGDTVTGSYPLYEGRIEGTVRGRALEGRWDEASGRSGEFLFSLSPDGYDFMGRFDGGEWWTGTRISHSHEFQTPGVNLRSPRETLRSFMTAGNAARGGFIERIRPALDTIDFSDPALREGRTIDGPLRPQEKIDYARQLFRVLDELTFHIWSLPGDTEPELPESPRLSVTLKQAGTAESFDLGFVHRDGAWFITPPSPVALDETLARLAARHGGRPPFAGEHLLLKHPRATMRTFIEEMQRFDSGGRQAVLRTMDLAHLDSHIQADEANLLAHYLKQVIDRISFVIYQEIPNDPLQNEPYVHFRHAEGDIIIAPVATGDDQMEWRFTADTLGSLRSLYTAIEDMPMVDGISAVDHSSPYFKVRQILRGRAPGLLALVGPIEGWQWLAIVVFMLTSILFAFIFTAVILWLLRHRGSWAEAVTSGRMRLALVWPLRFTFIGLLWYLKVGAFGLPEIIAGPIRSTAATIAIGSGLWLAYRGIGLVGQFSNRSIGTTGHKAVVTSLSLGILRVVLVVAAVLMMSDAWSLPYSSVLAGLGVGGLALALAAKQTVQNVIAGFTLFIDNPLSVGDFCRYGDKLGTVEQIGLRSTRIRSRDRTLISIPNAEFANMQLENFAKRDRILLQTTIGLRYETTLDQLRFVLAEFRRLLIGHPKVDPDPARVRFAGFGSYSIDVEIYTYIRTPDWNEFLAIREDLFFRMMRIISHSGTQFAFPSQVNYLTRDTGNDADLTGAAENAVAAWTGAGQLPFPEFDPAEVAELEDRLDYPPEGSPGPDTKHHDSPKGDDHDENR
jgi:small-conductance mechanosensitive channel